MYLCTSFITIIMQTYIETSRLILRDWKEEDIPALAVAAFNDVCTGGNPRPTSVEDIEALYHKAF